MALNKAILKASIKQAFADQKTKTSNPDAAIDDLCDKIANAIDIYVKGATVTIVSGIAVATTGSAVAQTGATTTAGTGSLS